MSSATTLLVVQRLGHVAGDDALGEALDDRRLADARLADQHRVVLGAAREHLDHAADLVVAADHRVELALLGGLGEVAAVLLERLVLVLGVLVGDAVRAADLPATASRDLVARGAGVDLRVGGEREQQVLGRHVLVAHRARPRRRRACSSSISAGASAGAAVGVAADGRQGVERLVRARGGPPRIGARAAQHRHDDAAVLLEQRGEQVLRVRLRGSARAGEPLRGCECLLGLDGEAIGLHARSRSSS